MRDHFGQDAGDISEGAPAATTPVAAAVAASPPPAVAPQPAAGSPMPNLQQAVDKAVAKAAADAQVASDPNAVHAVNIMPGSPTVLGSTLLAAGIGAACGGPPGALIGAGIGFLMEKYQIAGGPVGKLASWINWQVRTNWATAAQQQQIPGWVPGAGVIQNLPNIPVPGGAAPSSGVGTGTGS